MNKDDSRKSFDDTPKGWQERWTKEMEAADKMVDKFWEQGDKILKRYLDERESTESYTRLNLFHSGINTIRSMLYGQIPKVDFDRRYADPDDDVARVASTIYERMLNADIERPDDDYSAVLRSALDDRLVPGLGAARVRYEAEFEDTPVPAIYSEDGVELAPEYLESTLKFERAVIEYVHWKDLLWANSRTWHEVRWLAFRSWLTYDELVARFGEEKAKKVPIAKTKDLDTKESEAWQKGEIWEIWNKENKRVYWYAEGMDEILDDKEDLLKLKSFFPGPRPMMANCTTTQLIPKADFLLAQDLYDEIDILNTRISKLTAACRVVGVYDKSNPELQRMLKESSENDMIPVENWAMFGEKGGMAGAVDWFPLEQVVNTMDKLRELRSEQIGLLYQVTGLSDILRGQSEGSDRVSATEQSIKAKFASVRMQSLQDEFARFGTDLIRIKGEVVAKHCRPETILKASNVMNTADRDLAGPAIELLKSDEDFVWRVFVRPESMSMVDYQSLQTERTAYIGAVSQFMQSAAPMLERLPNSLPTLLELLKWGLAGFKGADTIESVMDKATRDAVEAAKNPPPKEPDPAMVKAQADMQMMQAKMQNDQQAAQIKMMENQQKIAADAQAAKQELIQDQMKFVQEMKQDQMKFMQEMMQMQQKASVEKQVGEQKIELAEEAAEVKNRAIQNKPESSS